jgi:hypothetical protein
VNEAAPLVRHRSRAWERTTAAATLGAAYLLARRHRAPRDSVPGGPARAAAGALCAAGGPALLVLRRLGGENARWLPPPSVAGRLLLGGHVLAGALVEEVLWRGPLILLATPARTGARAASARRAVPVAMRTVPAALLSAAGFLALHVRRDGAGSLPVHLTTTASWTASALLGRQLRWPVLCHAGYNFAAAGLRATDRPAR